MHGSSPLAVENQPTSRSDARHAVTSRAMDATLERRRLEQELRHALSQDGFVLNYQPSVQLASGTTVGGEALLRWPHRRRGLVAPGLFLPVAERSALATHIGGWVLRAACVEAATWPAKATVTVNVSPRHLADGALLEHLAEALHVSGLDSERLELDLPEPALLEAPEEVLLTLAALRDLGVAIAVDNFGSGYASLGVLRRLPLTAIKLDRSLIRTLPDDSDDAAIVRAVAESAHGLGLEVAAGGIETAAQRDFLAQVGCDQGQGHLFSQALSSADLRARLGT